MSQNELSQVSSGNSSSVNLSQLQHIFGNAPPTISTIPSGTAGSSASLSGTPSNTGGSYRPRRKNTKPDLSFRNDDTSSVHHDDASDRHSHYKRRVSRQPNLINTIVIWLKNTNKMRYIHITKFFYRWKATTAFINYQMSLPSPQIGAESLSSDRKMTPATPTSGLLEVVDSNDLSHAEQSVNSSPNSQMDPSKLPQGPPSSSSSQYYEQRNQYLQLFAENEKLREQILEMKRTMRATERSTRQHSIKLLVTSLLKKRLMSKLRHYFDVWQNNAKIIQMMNEMKHKQIELYVGLQQIESEREYVKSLESINGQLKMALFLTIFFYQWKSKTSMLLLHSEREKYEQQKVIIHSELAKIRKIIEQSNHLEATEMKSSRMRGEQLQGSLLSLQQKLAGIVQTNQQFRQQQKQLLIKQFQQLQQQQRQQQHSNSGQLSSSSASTSSSHHQNRSSNPSASTPNLKRSSSMSGGGGGSGGGNGEDLATRHAIATNTPFANTSASLDNNSVNSSSNTNSYTNLSISKGRGTGSGSKKDKLKYST